MLPDPSTVPCCPEPPWVGCVISTTAGLTCSTTRSTTSSNAATALAAAAAVAELDAPVDAEVLDGAGAVAAALAATAGAVGAEGDAAAGVALALPAALAAAVGAAAGGLDSDDGAVIALQPASSADNPMPSNTRAFIPSTINPIPIYHYRVAAEDTYVRLDKADFQFCSAHFCVFPGEREPLHGHNYRLYVELGGQMDELGYVAEFGWLKSLVRQLAAELDHRVLIAERCPELHVALDGGQVRVQWRSDCWSFPEGDVIRLPLPNT